MQQLSQRLDQLAAFSDEQEQLATSIFADAEALSFDSEGRVTLSDRLRAHAGLEEEAVFVGQGATFKSGNPNCLSSIWPRRGIGQRRKN
jgi:MraZ protein